MTWRKSTYSNGGESACVEVANAPGEVGVRDTKQEQLGDDARTVLRFTPEAWQGFTASLR